VPLGCTDLVGASNVQSLAGANAKVEQDEHSAPTNLLDIAQLQYGAEDCVWDGSYAVPGSTLGAYLRVDVAPDGKSDFESQFTNLMASLPNLPHAAAVENVAGDQSGFWCANDLETLGTDGPSRTCDTEMIVDDYWISIDVGDVIGTDTSADYLGTHGHVDPDRFGVEGRRCAIVAVEVARRDTFEFLYGAHQHGPGPLGRWEPGPRSTRHTPLV
jgi:hypothetical protein